MSGRKDITGQRFGRLVVLSWDCFIKKDGGTWWRCRCDCGNETSIRGYCLKNGDTTSCGCRRQEMLARGREIGALLSSAKTTARGYVGTLAYKTWRAMLQRCRDTNAGNYKNYGGRGIMVCERWLDFGNFFADMGPRPPGTSIDRIDPNGNYEPGNCRWVTAKDQSANRRPLSEQIKREALINLAKGREARLGALKKIRT